MGRPRYYMFKKLFKNLITEGEEDVASAERDEPKTSGITMDIELFIRMLEWSREDSQTDMQLHRVAENAETLSAERAKLEMRDYDELIANIDDNE